jgi:hypothetical protein
MRDRRGRASPLQSQWEPFEEGNGLFDDLEMIIVAMLPGDEVVFDVYDTDSINLKWAYESALPKQGRGLSLYHPVDGCSSLIEETLQWGVLKSGHLLKALYEPGENLLMPPSGVFHARVKEFCILCIKGENLFRIMGIEGGNPLINDWRNYLRLRLGSWIVFLMMCVHEFFLFPGLDVFLTQKACH